ncbi:MFS transporter [Pseudomonas sp. F1_0610]|uniref:MFS transporter n=1 Tax=Pseudomonas sp. F1_0610 TaxID=3114284 RepID=UPI0039C31D45
MIMFENDYQIAWGIYLAAGLMAMLVWMKMTGWMWRYLREPLWVAMGLIIFTPAIIDTQWYSPAIVVIASWLVLGESFPVITVADFAGYTQIAFGTYIAFAVVRFPFLRMYQKRKKAKLEAQALAQQQRQAEEAQIIDNDEPIEFVAER